MHVHFFAPKKALYALATLSFAGVDAVNLTSQGLTAVHGNHHVEDHQVTGGDRADLA